MEKGGKEYLNTENLSSVWDNLSAKTLPDIQNTYGHSKQQKMLHIWTIPVRHIIHACISNLK